MVSFKSVESEIKAYQTKVIDRQRKGSDEDGDSQWSFAGAFLFSLTVITTIGERFRFQAFYWPSNNCLFTRYAKAVVGKSEISKFMIIERSQLARGNKTLSRSIRITAGTRSQPAHSISLIHSSFTHVRCFCVIEMLRLRKHIASH